MKILNKPGSLFFCSFINILRSLRQRCRTLITLLTANIAQCYSKTGIKTSKTQLGSFRFRDMDMVWNYNMLTLWEMQLLQLLLQF